jgi:predicted transcriptional regulator
VTLSNEKARPLTDLQQAILDYIWSDGPVNADQVREALMPKHPLKDSSVRTLLNRLVERGYLHRKMGEKTYVYQAAVEATGVAARMVRQIIRRFCDGSAEQFLLGMVDEKVLTPEQIERLAKRISAKK